MNAIKQVTWVILFFLLITGFLQMNRDSYLLGDGVKAICCNNGLCDGQGCGYTSSVKSEDYLGCSQDYVGIDCKDCMDLQRQDRACGHRDIDEYCVEADQSKYYVCAPMTVSISGPSQLNPGQSGTFTASVSGGTSTFTYQWYRRVDCNDLDELDNDDNNGTRDTPCGRWYTYGSNSTSVQASAWQDFSMKVRVTDSCPQTPRVVYSQVWSISVGSDKSLSKKGKTFDSEINAKYNAVACPNPFNPQTEIQFQLLENAIVSVDFYNSRGQKVKTLASSVSLSEGRHLFHWNSQDDDGNLVSSGLYFCHIRVNESYNTLKVSLMR